MCAVVEDVSQCLGRSQMMQYVVVPLTDLQSRVPHLEISVAAAVGIAAGRHREVWRAARLMHLPVSPPQRVL